VDAWLKAGDGVFISLIKPIESCGVWHSCASDCDRDA
jgi:hypothetical protein